MITRPLAAALCTTVMSLGVVGCAEDPQVELSMTPAEARQAAAGLYVGDARLRFAEQSLIAQCMKQEELPYEVAPEGADSGLPTMALDDVAKARREGYGLAAERAQAQAVATLEGNRIDLPRQLQREYELVLFGPADAPQARARSLEGDVITASTEGCIAESRDKLFGSVANFLTISEFLGNSVRLVMYQAREDSDEVAAAFEAWQDCMAEAGYAGLEERNGGEALVRVAYEEKSLAQASDLEVEVATTDAECDLESGYTEAATAAENRALAEYFSEYEGQVAGIQEIRERAIDNARDLLIG